MSSLRKIHLSNDGNDIQRVLAVINDWKFNKAECSNLSIGKGESFFFNNIQGKLVSFIKGQVGVKQNK